MAMWYDSKSEKVKKKHSEMWLIIIEILFYSTEKEYWWFTIYFNFLDIILYEYSIFKLCMFQIFGKKK